MPGARRIRNSPAFRPSSMAAPPAEWATSFQTEVEETRGCEVASVRVVSACSRSSPVGRSGPPIAKNPAGPSSFSESAQSCEHHNGLPDDHAKHDHAQLNVDSQEAPIARADL